MATSPQTIAFLLDQLAGSGPIRASKMFGEYCLYFDDRPVALICDDQLFLKPTAAGKNLIATPIEGAPYPGARAHFLIGADLWEEREWLGRLIRVTASELPLPRPKKKKA